MADFNRVVSPQAVLEIRYQWDNGTINVREWATALDCGLETIRRIGRRDTYRGVKAGQRVEANHPKGAAATLTAFAYEPTTLDTSASIAKLNAILEEQQAGPKLVNALLDEMKGERRNATLDSSELAFGDPGVGEAGEQGEQGGRDEG